ncbi:hypothetical protein [Priestia megaterium]|uniref:hypothetical protein n=1 Tax=Priestia megaterium TaxID=1404 RepID=UPI00363E6B80
MPVSNKARKILWGRSANRCAICKKELVEHATSLDDSSVIGEECHIISAKKMAPGMIRAFLLKDWTLMKT